MNKPADRPFKLLAGTIVEGIPYVDFLASYSSSQRAIEELLEERCRQSEAGATVWHGVLNANTDEWVYRCAIEG